MAYCTVSHVQNFFFNSGEIELNILNKPFIFLFFLLCHFEDLECGRFGT